MGLFVIFFMSGVGICYENNKELFVKLFIICFLLIIFFEVVVIIFIIVFCLIFFLVVVFINCYLIKVSY